MTEQNIGAARVHLVVDASDYDSILARALNSAKGFGEQAEAAFDRSAGGARRASQRLLDYLNDLKRVGNEQSRFAQLLQRAAKEGADPAILKAAVAEWNRHATAVELSRIETEGWASAQQKAQAAAREVAQEQARQAASVRNLAEEYAKLRVESISAANERASQASFNSFVAPGLSRGPATANGATISALQEQLALEGQIEAEAHNINTEYQRWQAQIDAIGKDFYEIQIMQARQRYGSAADPIVRQIEQFRALNTNIHGTTVNTKQLQQALRFLPAQFTDIGVSAAAGMNPLLIVLQQGGQILDQFRLAGLKTKDTLLTVARYALSLVNPWTVAGVAIAGVAYAAYDASKSMQDLAVATAKGNQVAGSAESLYALADKISEINKVNTGSAEAAVARLAAGGRLAGDNLALAAEATARWAAVSGEKADDVAGKFEAIARGPLEAIENGTIRVTQKQYDYIRSLVEHGQQQEAVNALTKIFYDTVNNNSDTVERHLTGVSRLAKEIRDAFGAATRNVGEFFNAAADSFLSNGFTPTGIAQAMVNRRLAAAAAAAGTGSNGGSTLYDPEAEKREKKRADDLARWNATADKAAERQLQLNRLREEGKRLGQSEAAINAVLLRQQKEWAEQDAKKNRSQRDGTKVIRDAAAAEIASITTQTRLVQSQYEQREISVADYYGKLRSFADQELAITLRSIDRQKKAVAGRDDAVQRIEELESQAASARERYAQRAIDLDEGQRKAVLQLAIAYRQFERGLADSNVQMQRQTDAQLAQLTMGAQEYSRLQAKNEILDQQDKLLKDIRRQVEDRQITAEEGEKRIAAAIANTGVQLAILKSGYEKVDAAQQDFFTGTQRAWKDWLEETANTAKSGYDLMTSSLTGFNDAIADGIRGNLNGFKDFFNNLHYEILKFIVRQQFTPWLKSLGEKAANSGSQGGGNWFTSLVGALFGQKVTANAQGGVYGGSGLSAYRNSIVSQPTVFPFSRGGVPNLGIMGERSGKPHEAIFPVTRMAGGDLGVKVVDSGSRGPITINQPIYVQGRVDDRTSSQIAAKAGRESARALSRSGN